MAEPSINAAKLILPTTSHEMRTVLNEKTEFDKLRKTNLVYNYCQYSHCDGMSKHLHLQVNKDTLLIPHLILYSRQQVHSSHNYAINNSFCINRLRNGNIIKLSNSVLYAGNVFTVLTNPTVSF